MEGKDNNLIRKPRYLERNKRKACLRAEKSAVRLIEKQKNISNDTTTTTTNITSTTNTTPSISATITTTTVAITTLQPISTTSSINNTTTTTTTTTSSSIVTPTIIDSNRNNLSITTINKRPPERVGSIVGNAERYVVNDRDEMKLNASGRQVFVINKNLKFFKLASVRRAKKSHPLVTKRKYKYFQRFTQKWLKEHVSESLEQQCLDWLMGKTLDPASGTTTATTTITITPTPPITTNNNIKTKVLIQQDIQRTPYRAYNRYKVYGNSYIINDKLHLNTTGNNNTNTNINNNNNNNTLNIIRPIIPININNSTNNNNNKNNNNNNSNINIETTTFSAANIIIPLSTQTTTTTTPISTTNITKTDNSNITVNAVCKDTTTATVSISKVNEGGGGVNNSTPLVTLQPITQSQPQATRAVES